jgi:hypothetical protein
MTAVSAHVVLKTRDCVTRGCVEAAVKGLATCRRHAPVAELRRLREEQEAVSGVVAMSDDGLAALERMDAGEPQPEREPAHEPEPGHDAEVDTGFPCKVDGCAGRSTLPRGSLSFLCDEHAVEAKESMRQRMLAAHAARRAASSVGESLGSELGGHASVPAPAETPAAATAARLSSEISPGPPCLGDEPGSPTDEPPTQHKTLARLLAATVDRDTLQAMRTDAPRRANTVLMAPRARTPFEDTSVSVARSQDQIRKLLRDAGAQGVQFSEEWGDPPAFSVRFLWRLEAPDTAASGVVQAIRLRVEPLPEDHDGVWKTSDQRERQAWRGIAHYLEGTIKAATFGLIRFEDIFLSFMELEPMGRTLGETVIPQIARGRLELLPGQVEVT